MEKLISVIIPCYNANKTIERAIKSINDKDVEIVVVIDGVTDNTEQTILNLQEKNIKIVKQPNKGQFVARKNGIINSTGKYIMFLDADDYYCLNTIQNIKDLIVKYREPDLIRFRYEKVPSAYEQYKYFEEEEKILEKKDFQKNVYPMFIDGYKLNALFTNCVKSEILKQIELANDDLRYGEDLALNLEIFLKINNAVFTNKILYKYVATEDSITRNRSSEKWIKNLEDCITVYTSLNNYLIKWNMITEENLIKVSHRIEKESRNIIEIIKKCKKL